MAQRYPWWPAAIVFITFLASSARAATSPPLGPDAAVSDTVPAITFRFETDETPGWAPGRARAPITRAVAVLLAGAAAAAVSVDDENADPLARWLDGSPLDATADLGNAFGNGWVIGGGSLAALGLGSVLDDDRMTAMGGDLSISFVTASAASSVLKFGFDRRRPSGGSHSFPSGHTCVAFCTVPVLAEHLGWWVAAPVGVLATSTGLGRIEEGRHYLSDVLFGAALGYAVGDLVVNRRADGRARIKLGATGDRVGLVMAF